MLAEKRLAVAKTVYWGKCRDFDAMTKDAERLLALEKNEELKKKVEKYE